MSDSSFKHEQKRRMRLEKIVAAILIVSMLGSVMLLLFFAISNAFDVSTMSGFY